jgi:anti-sigma factor RsiW
MKCREVYLHVCDNLDQDIRSPKCRLIRKHLESCPDCAAFLQSLKKTVSLYRAVPAPPLPKTAHRRLLTTLRRLELHDGKYPGTRRTKKRPSHVR